MRKSWCGGILILSMAFHIPEAYKHLHTRVIAIILLLVVGAGAYLLMIKHQQQKDNFMQDQQAILNRLGDSSTTIPRLSTDAQADLLSKRTNTNQPSASEVNGALTTGLPK